MEFGEHNFSKIPNIYLNNKKPENMCIVGAAALFALSTGEQMIQGMDTTTTFGTVTILGCGGLALLGSLFAPTNF